MGKTEKCLTSFIGIELSLLDRVFVGELFKTIKSFTRGNTLVHGTFSLEVSSELINIDNQGVDVHDKLLLEFSLLTLELVSELFRLSNKSTPIFLEGNFLIHLFLVHDISEP